MLSTKASSIHIGSGCFCWRRWRREVKAVRNQSGTDQCDGSEGGAAGDRGGKQPGQQGAHVGLDNDGGDQKHNGHQEHDTGKHFEMYLMLPDKTRLRGGRNKQAVNETVIAEDNAHAGGGAYYVTCLIGAAAEQAMMMSDGKRNPPNAGLKGHTDGIGQTQTGNRRFYRSCAA